MGYHNCKRAELVQGLTPRARCVLNTMSLTAIDEQAEQAKPPHLYWGGWEFLALFALGYPKYDTGSKSQVARAMRELQDRGLVTVDGHGPGGRVQYRLHLPLDPRGGT